MRRGKLNEIGVHKKTTNKSLVEAPRRQAVINLNALDTVEEFEPYQSEVDSVSSSSNSDYDLTTYVSHAPEQSDFDEGDVSAVGDVCQFMELKGQTESEHPHCFQDLLQYLG